MELGAFSISLNVADLDASTDFYRALGFEVTGGDGDSWSILVNGNTVIGLFHGMFDRNIMTFNPGWNGPGQEADSFTDVRELRNRLVEAGIEPQVDNTGDSAEGPAHVVITDPDGNPIMLDQHR
ncbi:MAG: VOC family protein [Actinomycetota bacterium]